MKRLVKHTLAGPVLGRIAAAWCPNELITLAYHRIRVRGEICPLADSLFGPDRETFAGQIAWLSQNTSPISEADLLDCIERRRPFPKRATLVTFDDGYRDNFTQAAPILKRYRVPAIYFVPTAALNKRELFWWDELARIIRETGADCATLCGSELDLSADGRQRLLNSLTEYFKRTDASTRRRLIQELQRALKIDSVPHEIPESTLMTLEQVRALIDYGISVGCHTVSHPCLSRLSPEAQEKELQQSKTELESWTGRACVSVAYPFGGAEHFNAATKAISRKLGFRLGFSLIPGVDRLDCLDPWALCRFAAPSDLDSFALWLNFPRFMSFRKDRLDRKTKGPGDSEAPLRWGAAPLTAQSESNGSPANGPKTMGL